MASDQSRSLTCEPPSFRRPQSVHEGGMTVHSHGHNPATDTTYFMNTMSAPRPSLYVQQRYPHGTMPGERRVISQRVSPSPPPQQTHYQQPLPLLQRQVPLQQHQSPLQQQSLPQQRVLQQPQALPHHPPPLQQQSTPHQPPLLQQRQQSLPHQQLLQPAPAPQQYPQYRHQFVQQFQQTQQIHRQGYTHDQQEYGSAQPQRPGVTQASSQSQSTSQPAPPHQAAGSAQATSSQTVLQRQSPPPSLPIVGGTVKGHPPPEVSSRDQTDALTTTRVVVSGARPTGLRKSVREIVEDRISRLDRVEIFQTGDGGVGEIEKPVGRIGAADLQIPFNLPPSHFKATTSQRARRMKVVNNVQTSLTTLVSLPDQSNATVAMSTSMSARGLGISSTEPITKPSSLQASAGTDVHHGIQSELQPMDATITDRLDVTFGPQAGSTHLTGRSGVVEHRSDLVEASSVSAPTDAGASDRGEALGQSPVLTVFSSPQVTYVSATRDNLRDRAEPLFPSHTASPISAASGPARTVVVGYEVGTQADTWSSTDESNGSEGVSGSGFEDSDYRLVEDFWKAIDAGAEFFVVSSMDDAKMLLSNEKVVRALVDRRMQIAVTPDGFDDVDGVDGMDEDIHSAASPRRTEETVERDNVSEIASESVSLGGITSQTMLSQSMPSQGPPSQEAPAHSTASSGMPSQEPSGTGKITDAFRTVSPFEGVEEAIQSPRSSLDSVSDTDSVSSEVSQTEGPTEQIQTTPHWGVQEMPPSKVGGTDRQFGDQQRIITEEGLLEGVPDSPLATHPKLPVDEIITAVVAASPTSSSEDELSGRTTDDQCSKETSSQAMPTDALPSEREPWGGGSDRDDGGVAEAAAPEKPCPPTRGTTDATADSQHHPDGLPIVGVPATELEESRLMDEGQLRLNGALQHESLQRKDPPKLPEKDGNKQSERTAGDLEKTISQPSALDRLEMLESDNLGRPRKAGVSRQRNTEAENQSEEHAGDQSQRPDDVGERRRRHRAIVQNSSDIADGGSSPTDQSSRPVRQVQAKRRHQRQSTAADKPDSERAESNLSDGSTDSDDSVRHIDGNQSEMGDEVVRMTTALTTTAGQELPTYLIVPLYPPHSTETTVETTERMAKKGRRKKKKVKRDGGFGEADYLTESSDVGGEEFMDKADSDHTGSREEVEETTVIKTTISPKNVGKKKRHHHSDFQGRFYHPDQTEELQPLDDGLPLGRHQSKHDKSKEPRRARREKERLQGREPDASGDSDAVLEKRKQVIDEKMGLQSSPKPHDGGRRRKKVEGKMERHVQQEKTSESPESAIASSLGESTMSSVSDQISSDAERTSHYDRQYDQTMQTRLTTTYGGDHPTAVQGIILLPGSPGGGAAVETKVTTTTHRTDRNPKRSSKRSRRRKPHPLRDGFGMAEEDSSFASETSSSSEGASSTRKVRDDGGVAKRKQARSRSKWPTDREPAHPVQRSEGSDWIRRSSHSSSQLQSHSEGMKGVPGHDHQPSSPHSEELDQQSTRSFSESEVVRETRRTIIKKSKKIEIVKDASSHPSDWSMLSSSEGSSLPNEDSLSAEGSSDEEITTKAVTQIISPLDGQFPQAVVVMPGQEFPPITSTEIVTEEFRQRRRKGKSKAKEAEKSAASQDAKFGEVSSMSSLSSEDEVDSNQLERGKSILEEETIRVERKRKANQKSHSNQRSQLLQKAAALLTPPKDAHAPEEMESVSLIVSKSEHIDSSLIDSEDFDGSHSSEVRIKTTTKKVHRKEKRHRQTRRASPVHSSSQAEHFSSVSSSDEVSISGSSSYSSREKEVTRSTTIRTETVPQQESIYIIPGVPNQEIATTVITEEVRTTAPPEKQASGKSQRPKPSKPTETWAAESEGFGSSSASSSTDLGMRRRQQREEVYGAHQERQPKVKSGTQRRSLTNRVEDMKDHGCRADIETEKYFEDYQQGGAAHLLAPSLTPSHDDEEATARFPSSYISEATTRLPFAPEGPLERTKAQGTTEAPPHQRVHGDSESPVTLLSFIASSVSSDTDSDERSHHGEGEATTRTTTIRTSYPGVPAAHVIAGHPGSTVITEQESTTRPRRHRHKRHSAGRKEGATDTSSSFSSSSESSEVEGSETRHKTSISRLHGKVNAAASDKASVPQPSGSSEGESAEELTSVEKDRERQFSTVSATTIESASTVNMAESKPVGVLESEQSSKAEASMASVKEPLTTPQQTEGHLPSTIPEESVSVMEGAGREAPAMHPATQDAVADGFPEGFADTAVTEGHGPTPRPAGEAATSTDASSSEGRLSAEEEADVPTEEQQSSRLDRPSADEWAEETDGQLMSEGKDNQAAEEAGETVRHRKRQQQRRRPQRHEEVDSVTKAQLAAATSEDSNIAAHSPSQASDVTTQQIPYDGLVTETHTTRVHRRREAARRNKKALSHSSLSSSIDSSSSTSSSSETDSGEEERRRTTTIKTTYPGAQYLLSAPGAPTTVVIQEETTDRPRRRRKPHSGSAGSGGSSDGFGSEDDVEAEVEVQVESLSDSSLSEDIREEEARWMDRHRTRDFSFTEETGIQEDSGKTRDENAPEKQPVDGRGEVELKSEMHLIAGNAATEKIHLESKSFEEINPAPLLEPVAPDDFSETDDSNEPDIPCRPAPAFKQGSLERVDVHEEERSRKDESAVSVALVARTVYVALDEDGLPLCPCCSGRLILANCEICGGHAEFAKLQELLARTTEELRKTKAIAAHLKEQAQAKEVAAQEVEALKRLGLDKEKRIADLEAQLKAHGQAAEKELNTLRERLELYEQQADVGSEQELAALRERLRLHEETERAQQEREKALIVEVETYKSKAFAEADEANTLRDQVRRLIEKERSQAAELARSSGLAGELDLEKAKALKSSALCDNLAQQLEDRDATIAKLEQREQQLLADAAAAVTGSRPGRQIGIQARVSASPTSMQTEPGVLMSPDHAINITILGTEPQTGVIKHENPEKQTQTELSLLYDQLVEVDDEAFVEAESIGDDKEYEFEYIDSQGKSRKSQFADLNEPAVQIDVNRNDPLEGSFEPEWIESSQTHNAHHSHDHHHYHRHDHHHRNHFPEDFQTGELETSSSNPIMPDSNTTMLDSSSVLPDSNPTVDEEGTPPGRLSSQHGYNFSDHPRMPRLETSPSSLAENQRAEAVTGEVSSSDNEGRLVSVTTSETNQMGRQYLSGESFPEPPMSSRHSPISPHDKFTPRSRRRGRYDSTASPSIGSSSSTIEDGWGSMTDRTMGSHLPFNKAPMVVSPEGQGSTPDGIAWFDSISSDKMFALRVIRLPESSPASFSGERMVTGLRIYHVANPVMSQRRDQRTGLGHGYQTPKHQRLVHEVEPRLVFDFWIHHGLCWEKQPQPQRLILCGAAISQAPVPRGVFIQPEFVSRFETGKIPSRGLMKSLVERFQYRQFGEAINGLWWRVGHTGIFGDGCFVFMNRLTGQMKLLPAGGRSLNVGCSCLNKALIKLCTLEEDPTFNEYDGRSHPVIGRYLLFEEEATNERLRTGETSLPNDNPLSFEEARALLWVWARSDRVARDSTRLKVRLLPRHRHGQHVDWYYSLDLTATASGTRDPRRMAFLLVAEAQRSPEKSGKGTRHRFAASLSLNPFYGDPETAGGKSAADDIATPVAKSFQRGASRKLHLRDEAAGGLESLPSHDNVVTPKSGPMSSGNITHRTLSGLSQSPMFGGLVLTTKEFRVAYCQAVWFLCKLHDVHAAAAGTPRRQ